MKQPLHCEALLLLFRRPYRRDGYFMADPYCVRIEVRYGARASDLADSRISADPITASTDGRRCAVTTRERQPTAATPGHRGGCRFKREDLDGFLECRRAEGTDVG